MCSSSNTSGVVKCELLKTKTVNENQIVNSMIPVSP